MKRLAISVLLFLVIAAVQIAAHAEAMEQNPNWFKCSKETDCMVVKGICQKPTAISRKSEKEANAYFEYRGTTDSCIALAPDEPSAFKAHCQAGLCKIAH